MWVSSDWVTVGGLRADDVLAVLAGPALPGHVLSRNRPASPPAAPCTGGYRCLRARARRCASWPSAPTSRASSPRRTRRAGCGRCPAVPVRTCPSFRRLPRIGCAWAIRTARRCKRALMAVCAVITGLRQGAQRSAGRIGSARACPGLALAHKVCARRGIGALAWPGHERGPPSRVSRASASETRDPGAARTGVPTLVSIATGRAPTPPRRTASRCAA